MDIARMTKEKRMNQQQEFWSKVPCETLSREMFLTYYQGFLEFAVLVLNPRSKVSYFEWKYREPHSKLPPEQANLFENKEYNLGVLCGSASQIIVIDIDVEEAVTDEPALQWLFGFPTVKTHKGYHFYGRIPESWETVKTGQLTFTSGRKAPQHIGEVRGEKAYAVLPPSVHEEGTVYSWNQETLPVWFPNFTEEQLMGLGVEAPETHSPFDSTTTGLSTESRHSLEVYSLVPEKIKGVIEGVDEGGRHYASMDMAHFYLKKLLDIEAAWITLKAWNLLNRPPLGEAQLRQNFEDAVKFRAENHLDSASGQTGEGRIWDGASIMAETSLELPVKWGNLCFENCISLLFGYSSSGKSIYALAEGVSLSEYKPVYYIDLEAPYITRYRLRCIANQDSRIPRHLTLTDYLPKWESLEEFNGLVILDTIRAAAHGNFNDSDTVSIFLEPWRSWVRRPGRSLLLIAHSNKRVFSPESSAAYGLDFLEGSQYWAGGVDVIAMYNSKSLGGQDKREVYVIKNRIDGSLNTYPVKNYNLNLPGPSIRAGGTI